MMFFLIILMMLFLISNHPFSMITILIMMSIFISIMTFKMISTSWYSYIFLLIILSGVMMIFMYMATLSSNEYFSLTLTPVFLILPLVPKLLIYPPISSSSQTWSMKQNLMSFSSITILMVVFLFITMMSVTKISALHQGPLYSL